MKPTITRTEHESRRQALTALLDGPSHLPDAEATSIALVRGSASDARVGRLERKMQRIVTDAGQAGVDIDYLGINPLFNETRLYAGVDTDWVLQPVREAGDAVVPKHERRIIEQLIASGAVESPLVYVAHEVPKERSKELVLPEGPVVVTRSTAANLVGPVPEPKDSLALGEALGERAQRVMHTAGQAVRTVGTAAATVATAPMVALAGLATLDPIVLGAIPAGASNVGEPAGWFVLARWDW
jgi:hypothetical protein